MHARTREADGSHLELLHLLLQPVHWQLSDVVHERLELLQVQLRVGVVRGRALLFLVPRGRGPGGEELAQRAANCETLDQKFKGREYGQFLTRLLGTAHHVF